MLEYTERRRCSDVAVPEAITGRIHGERLALSRSPPRPSRLPRVHASWWSLGRKHP